MTFMTNQHSDENIAMTQLFVELRQYEAEFFGEYPSPEAIDEMAREMGES